MHLEALRTRAPHVLPLYREMAMAAIPLALEKGTVTDERADEIRRLVEQVQGTRSRLTEQAQALTRGEEVPTMRVTIRDLRLMKRRGERIPMLTAYDYTSARLVEAAGIPVILVGDSVGQWLLGYETDAARDYGRDAPPREGRSARRPRRRTWSPTCRS